MTAALIVENKLPKNIIPIDAAMLEKANTMAFQARSMILIDAETLAAGNAKFREIDALTKAIKEQRLEITRPIEELADAVRAAAKQATIPLDEARADLGDRIMKFDRKLKAEAAAAEAKARAEAEAKATAERARLEAERQAIIAKQQAEFKEAKEAAEKARAEAQAQADEEAALFGAVAPAIEVVEPTKPPEPPPVVVVPVLEAVRAPLGVPLGKCAVRPSKRKTLRIIDASKIPREIAGAALMIPDKVAIRKVLDAGIAVPGCVLEDEEGFASTGSK
jgi:hypothetical protein